MKDLKHPKKVHCLKCGSRIKNDFQSKWNHVVEKHPEHFAERFVPVLCEAFGVPVETGDLLIKTVFG